MALKRTSAVFLCSEVKPFFSSCCAQMLFKANIIENWKISRKKEKGKVRCYLLPILKTVIQNKYHKYTEKMTLQGVVDLMRPVVSK